MKSTHVEGAIRSSRRHALLVGLRARWFVYLIGLALPLCLYALFLGYPTLDTLYISLFRWNGLDPHKVFIGLDNYRTMLADPDFWLSLTNNIKWTVLTLLFPVTLGLLLAMLFNSKWLYLGGLFRVAIFLPTTMSLVVLGIMFELIYNPIFGGLNAALDLLGLGGLSHDWLGDPQTALYALVAAFSWQYTGFSMIIFHAGLRQIPTDLYEAARIDGAVGLAVFRFVTLPMLRPVITVVTVLTVINSLRSFDLIYVMTQGGPFKQTSVLGFLMYQDAFFNNQYGYAAAIGTAVLILSVVFAAVYLSQVARGAFHATS